MRFSEIKYVLSFLFFVLLQGIVFKNIILFEYAFCFIYVYYLLSLPVDTNPIVAVLVGFVMGLFVDMFYDTGGIHAAASVLLMFVRNKWLNMITPQGGYDVGVSPSIYISGSLWYTGYAFPAIFLHQLVLFYAESFGFGLFWFTLYKVVLSAIFTYIMCVVLQVLFTKR